MNEVSPACTFCIDGGGSKTELQILDAEGKVVKRVEAGPSNFSVVKVEGVRRVLFSLLGEYQKILPNCRIVAGMAGVGLPGNLTAVAAIFEELGARRDNLELLTDGGMALRLMNGNGIVLISGTGSICLAANEGDRYRVGGLGPILGDDGSGHQIALRAIKAAIAQEFAYGPKTSLTPALCTFFGVTELKNLLPQINSSEITAAKIASAAPIVFEKANEGDPVAKEIITQAAVELRKLVATALRLSGLANCQLHLWGGIFKGRYADEIIKVIKNITESRNIQIVNQSSENVAALFAQTFKKQDPPCKK